MYSPSPLFFYIESENFTSARAPAFSVCLDGGDSERSCGCSLLLVSLRSSGRTGAPPGPVKIAGGDREVSSDVTSLCGSHEANKVTSSVTVTLTPLMVGLFRVSIRVCLFKRIILHHSSSPHLPFSELTVNLQILSDPPPLPAGCFQTIRFTF